MPTQRTRLSALAAATVLLVTVPGAAQERRSLALEEARTWLRERSTELVVQDYSIRQAALLEDTARAVLLPSLNLQAQYTFRDREIDFAQANPYAPLAPYFNSVYDNDPALQQFFVDNPEVPDARNLAAAEFPSVTVQNRHDWRVTATLSQTLFNARAFPLLDQAETTYLQTENARRQIVYALEASLQALYFRALTLREIIGINERNLELERLAYERSVAAFEEEVGNRFEVNRAEVRLRRAELNLANARRDYEVSLEELALFISADEPFDVTTPPELVTSTDFEEVVSDAILTRATVEGDELAQRFARERIEEIGATWWPTLVAQADANVVNESAFSGDAFSWSISVILNWDVWDGGLRIAERETRELVLGQEEARQRQTVIDIESEVRRTWIQLQSQLSSLETARAEAELATRNVELTEAALEFGAATQLELETARNQAFLAELSVASSQIALQALIYEINRLAGRWQPQP